ncbi:hypothetical protein [uncultured Halovibrio sp.]|nr:hypothetical protein [uncultured Halovibrio sp.]
MTEAEKLQAILEQLQLMASMNFGLALVFMLALGWIAGHQR